MCVVVVGGGGDRENRGETMGGEEPVEADQGETRKTRGVGSFTKGAPRHCCEPAKNRSGGVVAGAINHQTHVTPLMMCLTNQPRVHLYSGQVLAAEALDRFALA